MKSATTGTVSGCVVWVIVFCILSTCITPVAFGIGGATSASDFAIQTMGRYLCPEGSTAQSYSYATTTTDEFGNRQPSTAYVLQCVDSSGEIVKEDPITYAFVWMGIIVLIGLVLTGLLALVLAAPAGVIIGKLFSRVKTNQ